MNKPRDANQFLDSLQIVKKEKMKASNLLFEEIENDVLQKEKFVVEQCEKIKQMRDSYSTLLDYEKVLMKVQTLIPQIGGGNVRASMGGTVQDEEAKF